MQKVLIKDSLDYWVSTCGRVFKGSRELKKNKATNGYVTTSIKYIDGTSKTCAPTSSRSFYS